MNDLLTVLAAWFVLGAISAVWIYLDQKKGSNMSGLWIALGFFLSLVGLAAYYFKGRKKAPAPFAPGSEFTKPDYKFEGEKEKVPEPPKQPVEVKLKKKEEKKEVAQLEGCPRCPKCGAAISVYDRKCWDCGSQLRTA